MPTPKLRADGTISVETPPTYPLPQSVIALIKSLRAAGQSDFQIVDTMENTGVNRPSYYGYVDGGGHNHWHSAAVAAVRAANGIS